MVDISRNVLKVDLEKVDAKPRPLDRGILASMASPVGQIYPIIAILEDDRWQVYDGNVRVRSARELKWTKIEVLPATDAFEAERLAHMITLAANARANNPLAEAKAIEAINDDEAAMQAGGLTKAEVRARRRLLALSPELQELVEEGYLALTAAKKLAKLPPDEQRHAYDYALEMMEEHNKERRRADRTVPTVAEVDAGVRRVRGALQPSIPDISDRLKKAPPSGPDPVAVAAKIKYLLDQRQYSDVQVKMLENAIDVLDGRWSTEVSDDG